MQLGSAFNDNACTVLNAMFQYPPVEFPGIIALLSLLKTPIDTVGGITEQFTHKLSLKSIRVTT